MYINTTNGAEVSVEEMQKYATEAEMSIEEYAAAAGFTLKSDENKTTDFPTSTTADADVVQQKETASKNTDLPTVDTSSDSSDPLDDYYVTIEDLRQDEEDASPALNIKLAGIGISTKQSTSFGSLDALNFENSTDPKVEGEGAGTKFFNKFIGNPTKIFSAIGIGINKTDEELALAAAEINEYIKLKADTSFLNKAKKRSGDDYEKYADTLKAPELSTEDLESSMKKDLVSEFSKIQRSEVSDDIAGFKKNSGEAIVVGTEQKDATVDQFKNEKEFKAYNQWKKNGYISDFSEDEILLYDDERKQKYALDASLRYASDLSIDGRMDVLALAANDEKKLNNFQEISSDYFKIEDSLKNAIKEYNLNPTQDKLIAANAIKIDYLQKQGEIQSLQGKLKKDGVFEKGRTIPLALTDLNKDYDYVRQLRTGFKSLAGNVTYAGASLAILAGKLQNPGAIAIELSSPESTSAKIESATGLVSLGDELQKESENFQRSIAVDEIRSVSDAGKWVAGSAVNLVPSLAMAMTGPAAMPLFFLSGMGSKGMEMAVSRKNSSERMIKNKQFLIDNPNADPSILMSLEQEMDEDAKILGIKEWQSLGIQALYGIAEVAMEKVGTMTLLKNLKNATKMLSPTTVKEGFKFLGKGLKEVGKGIRVEGGSEFGTTVAQNFGDIFILGEDKNLFEGGLESFAQGALMGGAMNSVGVAKGIRQGYISVLASRDETIKLRENLNALRKLTNQPEIESWEDLKNLKLKLPKETQSVVDAITLDMQKTEGGVLFKLGSTLSIEQAYKVEEANRKMRLINKQLIDASTNPSIKAAELTQIKSQLSIQFDALAKEREQLLSDSVDIKQTKESFVNANVSLDSTLGYEYYSQVMLNESIKSIAGNYSNLSPEANQAGLDAAKKDLIKEGKKDPSIKEIKAKAQKSYIDNAYKKKIEAGRSNAEAFAKQQGLDLEIMSFEGKDAEAQIIKAFKDAGVVGKMLAKTIKAVKNGSFEGGAIEGTNKIIINMNAAIENKRIGVFAHEVLHKYAIEKYKSNNTQGAIDKAGEDLLSYLEKNDKDLFAKVKFRIDQSYTEKDAEGNVIKDADYFEEAMNAMSDVLADGQVVNDKSMNKIRVFANSFLSKLPGKFQFTVDQGRGAYEFVKGYNKSSHFGGVKTPDSPIVNSTDDDEKAITREDKDKKVSFSKAPLLDKINSLVPPSITTQEEYFSPKIFNEVFKATEEGGAISNYIKSKASSKEAGIKTIKSIQERLTNYDPAAERKKAGNKEPITFGEFIFSNTPFAIRDAKKALFKESEAAKKKADLDSKEAQSKTAEESSGSKVDTRKKYKPLVSNPKLIPSFISSEIKTKLASITGKLKSKLSDRPKGKNAQTTPLVAEIKKAIGNVVKDPKALPKQIINRMGNPKDESYQKFLIDNKKSILENMTTTYLQSAIPAAIEKSVGGTYALDSDGKRKKDSNGNDIFKPKFVPYPEWVGKEIDREKVSTNKKGGTSGNQIVRRAIQKEVDGKFEDSITNEDFVANFVGSDGKVIRGKRESLGKALAEEAGFEVFVSELKNDKVVTQKDLDEDVIGQFEGKQAGDFVSDVRQEFKDNQEALGEILGDDTVALVSRDIERGTVKFSKGKKQALIEIANARSSKKVNEIIGIEKQAINNKNRTQKQKDFEKIITKYNLSLETFDGGALKNSGAIRTRSGKSDPDANKLNKWLAANPEIKSSPTEVWYALSNGDWIKGKKKIQDGKNIAYNLPSLEDIAKVGDGNATLIANTNRLYYGSSDPAYIAARKLAAKNSVDASVYKTGRVTTDFFGIKAIEKFKQNMLLMERVAYELQDAVAGGMPKEIAAMIIEGGYQATSGFIKIAAGFKYKSKVFEYALSGKPNQTRGKKYREEHNPPASTVGGTLLWAIVNNQVADVMPYVKKNYYQTQLSVKDDAKIDDAKLDGTLPEGYSLLNDPVIRLVKSGIGLSSLIDPNTGISMAQEYGVKVDDSALQLQPDVIEKQGELVERQLTDPKFTKKDSQKFIDQFIKLAPALNKANIINNKKLAYPFKEKVTTKKLLDRSNTIQKAINNGRSIKFSSVPKKIRVFDFDDTLARTKSNVLYTMPGEVRIFHGGDIKSVKDIDGFVYFSEDQKQAAAYAKGNQGEVSSFKIDETSIATENQVFDVINNLGIKPRAGYAVDESSLYELIDPRFEQSFSKKDLEKLAVALKRKGIKAARFTDTNISQGKNEGRETENIVVFDKKTVQEQAKLTAAEFAAKSDEMAAKGADFDFIEFSKVMNGQEGPLLKVAKIIAEKRGTDDLFVLTARPQNAAGPIQDFLAELGLDIPLENITGLADGNPKAKANWMVSKVAEGYNDFYFADDHLGNVKAVKDVFNTFDVKGKVQQAKIKFSKGLDKGFNDMIERQTGTESFKEFSKGVAQRRGKKVGKFKIFVSPSAEDFRGLTQYKFAGKGKQGEADQKFFEEALMDPYFKGVAAVEAARETIKNDTKALFKVFKPVKKKLNKLVPGIDFTYDGAVRVFLWNKAGIEIPGLTKRDNKKLNDAVANDPELSAFADALLLVSKQDAWPAPTEYWEAKTTLSDLNTLTEKTNRKEYLTEFIENVDIIFSEKNLNKVEALYGKASRVAIENAIYAMKTGSNSPNQSGDGITNRWLQWVNNSIGTIMFFNRRSALLQLTSATNFLNWSDNNPAKAALAFANQPQYWKDWAMIFNSDKLKQRRSGLKSDVQESEIANAAKNTEDKIGSIIAYLLKIGFSPTQIADSIAISSGGATFYRNRVNSLKKKGMSVAEAEAKAFEDFSKLSDEAQQSGDPALVSQQQRSVAGRLILSFQNTTMQYTRLMKKAGQDLINRRGDAKTHVSMILYYGALQNFIFNALSQTAFALIPGFDDDEDEDQVKRDEKLEEKASRVLNGMTDSIIRGTGIYGAVVTTIKNTYNTWEREADKGFKGDQAKTILEAANISPAIGSKLRKIYSAIQAYQFDKAVMEKHPWSVTIDGKFNPSATYSVIGNLASAGLNIPLDRALAEARGVAEMFDNRNSEMQRIALALGWRTWNVGADNEEFDLIKMEAKQQKVEDKKAEKANFDVYRRKVFKVLTRSENRKYSGTKGAKLKKEYILKLGKEKGIK